MEDLIWQFYYWRAVVGLALLPITAPLAAWVAYCTFTGRDFRPWVKRPFRHGRKA